MVIPAGPPTKLRVPPAQTGLLLDAVTAGAGRTTTSTVAEAVQPLLSVTVKVYVPAMAGVAFDRVGLCTFDV